MKTKLSVIAILLCLNLSAQNFSSQFEMMRDKLQKTKKEVTFRIPEYWQNVNLQLYDYGRVGVATIQTFDTRYEGSKGSPYLYDEWMKGAVMITGNNQPQLSLLNYDCENDQLIFRHKDGNPSSLPNEIVRSFVVQDSIQSDSLLYFVAIKTGKPKPSFYQVLYSGKTLLLERHKKVFRKADYQRAYSPDRRYDEYIDMNELFIYNEKEGNLQKIKLNKKSVLGLFPQYADKLESFMQNKDIKLKNNNELVQIISFLDTL